MVAALGAAVWIRGMPSGELWPATGWFFLVGMAGLGPGRLLYYFSIRRLGVSRAAVLNSVTPFMGILLGVVFLGERPTWHVPAGALFIVGGVVGLLADRSATRISPIAAFYGFIPTVFFALIPIFMRVGIRTLPDPVFGTLISALAALLILLLGMFTVPRKSRWGGDLRGIGFFLLAGLGYASAFLTFYKALSLGTVSIVLPVIYTSPLFSVIIARVMLQKLEQVTWRLAVGAVIVFIGVVLVSLSRAG
jgi:drug/metabolite transporter (DMT)-like permease